MIQDGLEGLSHADHDVCVVGSGPVGIAIALDLVRLGRRVLLLESGGDRAEAHAQSLSGAMLVDPARHDRMDIAVARRLGGTSNLWGGRCLPFDPIDFERRPINGNAVWPIDLPDLNPFYERAIGYARAGADVFATDELAHDARIFSTASLERWSSQRKAHVAHRDALARSATLDVRLHATVTALVWDDDRVTGVVAIGRDCAQVRVPVRQLVVATGGLESTRLLLAEQRASPRRFGGGDVLGRFYMGHVIGEIADIVFASETVDRAFDFTLDRHGSYVRRRIAPSPALLRRDDMLNCAFWPVVPQIANPAHRDGFLSAIAVGLSAQGLGRAILPEAIRLRHIPTGMARGPHVANVVRDLPGTTRDLARLLWRRYAAQVPAPAFYKRNIARRYGLAYHSEQAPQAESRVWLTRESDATGLPRLAIYLRFSDDDAASIVRLHDHLARWLPAAGLGRIEFREPPEERAASVLAQASHGTHQIGTARMSATSRTGVVDADLRVWGTRNLYVASSAVLPTSGQANPTLTVMALGLRLAARLSSSATVMPARTLAAAE